MTTLRQGPYQYIEGVRYQTTLTIPIAISRSNREPLHEQIAGQLRSAVDNRQLASGVQLPSTRTLAGALGVSRGVAAAAYDLLLDRGYVRSRAGSGTFVATAAPSGGDRPPAPSTRAGNVIDLTPGQVNPQAFPLAEWRAAWRRATYRQPPASALPARGVPELHRAISGYLRRDRGLDLTGTEVVVTGGTAHGLRLALDALENPAAASGELLFDDLPDTVRAVVVNPDGDPLAPPMPADRRRAAVRWAARTGGYLIELAGDHAILPPLSRLHTLADGTSIVVGGFCELLSPALKLGYLVVPRWLAPPVAELIAARGEQPPYETQLAIATLLDAGTLARLVQRTGRLRELQRRLVHAALAPLGTPVTGGACAAVLHRHDGGEIAAALLTRGVRADTLDHGHRRGSIYHAGGPPALGKSTHVCAKSGLVLGYGHLPDPVLHRALRIIVDLLSSDHWGGAGLARVGTRWEGGGT